MSTYSDHPNSGPYDGQHAAADDTADLLELRDQLDAAESQSSATAEAWRGWAAELAMLAARMPTLPRLLDLDGIDSRTVERDGIDPATLRTTLAGPVRAADHFAAVYTRHAVDLGAALADVLEAIDPPPAGPGTETADTIAEATR